MLTMKFESNGKQFCHILIFVTLYRHTWCLWTRKRSTNGSKGKAPPKTYKTRHNLFKFYGIFNLNFIFFWEEYSKVVRWGIEWTLIYTSSPAPNGRWSLMYPHHETTSTTLLYLVYSNHYIFPFWIDFFFSFELNQMVARVFGLPLIVCQDFIF